MTGTETDDARTHEWWVRASAMSWDTALSG